MFITIDITLSKWSTNTKGKQKVVLLEQFIDIIVKGGHIAHVEV